MLSILAIFAATSSLTTNVPVSDAGRTPLPETIRRAALIGRSNNGRIAGRRIGNTDRYLVYVKSLSGCGSGGCRAQLWKLDAGRPVRVGLIAVGHLPIVLLPEVDGGMPRIGVTITDRNRRVVLPIAFDGETYSRELYDDLRPRGAGTPLITESMLRPY